MSIIYLLFFFFYIKCNLTAVKCTVRCIKAYCDNVYKNFQYDLTHTFFPNRLKFIYTCYTYCM